MIQLTTETRVIKDSAVLKDKSAVGKVVDNSIYIDRADSNNLILFRGKEKRELLGFYGDVRSAFTRALNFAIKQNTNGSTVLGLQDILKRIDDMDNRIKELTVRDIDTLNVKEVNNG